MRFRALLTAVLGCLAPSTTLAQAWGDTATSTLVTRAIARRARIQSDTTLQDYRARAHGFVFFLGQFGEGLEEPPQLVKSDELVLEVYWKAPGRSKQRIVGWRERAELPTGIDYHRDHLGIVQNNFGNRIGLGHDDEVRNVLHPLAPRAPARYEYALVDSLTLRLPSRSIRVYEVLTRPIDRETAGVVGSLYLDAATAELVRFRFNFTRAAYVDKSLEDITIVLENGLWNQRYWLPRRQEIEIRRRTAWLDLPARGIIRGRWEITDYAFNVGLPDSLFRGFEVVAATPQVRQAFEWNVPLEVAIRETAGPALRVDLEEVRARVRTVIAERAVSGIKPARPSVGSLSELLHFNRVEGLTPGLGLVLRPAGGALEVRTWGAYGLSDERLKAKVAVARRAGNWRIELRAARTIEDIGDEPVIAPLLNSLVAQEAGDDFGDYVLMHRVQLGVRRRFGTGGAVSLTVGVERSASVEVRTTPANGAFRPNPPLGSGTYGVGTVRWDVRHPRAGRGIGGHATIAAEFGSGASSGYARLGGRSEVLLPVGRTELLANVWAGWGSDDLPAHRSFVLGGRGTLMSEPFRAYGGRHVALGRFEWRARAPFPPVALGSFASTGGEVVVGPFVSLGWVGASRGDLPWDGTDGVRAVVGVGLEWFHRLVRFEVGGSVRSSRVGFVVDIRRDLWSVL